MYDSTGSFFGGSSTNRYFVTITTTDTYYLRHDPSTGDEGDYTITATDITDDFTDNISTTGVLDAVNETVVSAGLQESGDEDWFLLTRETGVNYYITIESNDIDQGQLRIDLFSETGSGLSGSSNTGQFGFISSADGDLFVQVESISGVTGDYTIKAEIITDDLVNNPLTTGQLVLDGPAVASRVEFNQDADWFSLDVEDGKIYRVTVESDDFISTDSSLRVFDVNSNSVGPSSFTNELRFIANINTGGTETQFIQHQGDSGIFGDYTIQVEELIDEAGNDITSTAILPTDGTPVSGEFQYAGDLDVFRFEADAGTDYFVTTTLVNSAVGTAAGLTRNPDFAVLDSAGNTLQSSFNGATFEFTAPSDGVYYLRLSDGNFGTYEFNVVEVPRLEIIGTDGNDFLQGNTNDDTIDGLAGADVIVGEAGDDVLSGGNGNDTIIGGEGNDQILGGNEQDSLVGGLGNDSISGGAGNDTIIGGAGDDVIEGDGELSATASNSVIVPSTQQTLAVSLSVPTASQIGEATITGIISRAELTASNFNIAYIIDISGSVNNTFQGVETVGDLNSDGRANTLLDGEILAFDALNQSLIDAGLGNTNVTLIAFDSSSSAVFTGNANDDFNANGSPDVVDALRSLNDGGSTNFEAALQDAISYFDTQFSGENQIFFISDGFPNSSTSFLDEVTTLIDPAGIDASIRAIGLGSGSSLADLDLLDDGVANNSAEQVLEPSALTAGLTDSPVTASEIDRVEISVNGVIVQTLLAADLSVTPFGLQYSVDLSTLSVTEDDIVEARLVASDPAMTDVAASIVIPNAPGAGDDTINAGSGNDRVEGGLGNDVIFGENGNDFLDGGQGNDSISGGAGEDSLSGAEGDDVLTGGRDDDILDGGFGHDRLNGGTGRDIINGGAGDDIIIGGAGQDNINGGSGADTLSYANSGDRVIINLASGFANGGHATGDVYENIENLFGSAFDDRLTGDNGDNVIDGFNGDDILRGLDGVNVLNGGNGDDVFIGGDGADTHNGGGGFADTIDYSGSTSGVQARLGGSQVFDGGFATGDSFSGIEDLIGSDFNDILVGNIRANSLVGNAGNDFLNGDRGTDVLLGGDGNDTLIGGFGRDTIDGGDGIDQARYANANSRAVVDLEAGTGSAGHSFGDTLINIENLFGSRFNDVFTGDAGANELNGWIGADRLNGGEGNDVLIGGAGNDRFIFSDNWDDDIITDFEDGGDLLDFREVTGVSAITDLTIVNNANGDAVVSLGGDSITLIGIDAADLTAADFLF